MLWDKIVYFVSTIFLDTDGVCESYICMSDAAGAILIYLIIFFIPNLIFSFILAYSSRECSFSSGALALDWLNLVLFILFCFGGIN